RAVLLNPKDHPKHFEWTPLERMEPAIVHFPGANADEPPYLSEIRALRMSARGVPPAIIRAYTQFRYNFPHQAWQLVKNALRPLYHAILGPRPVRGTLR